MLALLPTQNHDPVMQRAFTQMLDAAEQHVVVLVGAEKWEEAVAAADAYTGVIRTQTNLLEINPSMNRDQSEWIALFNDHHLRLLTPDQRKLLETRTSRQWLETALMKLYSPVGGPKAGAWQDDPFDLFGGWLMNRASETPVRPREGRLFVQEGDRYYILVLMTLKAKAFSLETAEKTMPVLKQAERAARDTAQGAKTDIDVLSTGFLLYAAAGSAQAQKEISIIGLGSLFGVALLLWVTFRTIKSILMIWLSVIVGCIGAVSVCSLIFGQIHMLTLVFGASLLGVAQDYGIFFLCNRAVSNPEEASWSVLRRLLPSMILIFGMTVTGYMMLGFMPFPGLQQMALFSTVGLLFAWMTILCWFPVMARANFTKQRAPWPYYRNLLTKLPALGMNRATLIVALIFVGLAIPGIILLRANDDVRLLQNPPKYLIDDQIKISHLLDMPAAAQFYIVRGNSAEQVLLREEALKDRLGILISRGVISGYQAVSNWIPSRATQMANRDLIKEKLLDNREVLPALATAIGEDAQWVTTMRERITKTDTELTLEQFLSTPISETVRHLWIGNVGDEYASIVLLKNISRKDMPALIALANGMDGVQWVDKVEEISSVLRTYRHYMGWAVLLAYVAVFALLFIRYRKRSWQVIAPTIFAGIGTLGILGLTGQNLQLFTMVGFMLLLGLGVDYGIFWQEKVSGDKGYTWVEIGLCAVTALLSFGLLSLSATPVLHSFGLTLLAGLTLVWLFVPFFGRE